ncbi:MAG: dTDP-4-dehydrorhamnose reductase [Gelidibacter sp.]
MKTNILVTGANGQLGQTIKELFYKKDDNLNFTFVSKSELDITETEKLNIFFETHRFDYCINCAAFTNVELAEDKPDIAFKINAQAVKNLAHQCNLRHVVLIHISTDYVFDGKKQEPYNEEDKTNPINVYGASKLQGERYIKEILSEYFIIRTSWLYSKYGHNFVTTIINKLQDNKPLQITTSQTGTPTSCVDLSKFIIHLIERKNKNFGLYHFSAVGETTWYDFAIQIASHFNHFDSNLLLPIKTFQSKAKRPKYSVLNNNKAKQYAIIQEWKISLNTVLPY